MRGISFQTPRPDKPTSPFIYPPSSTAASAPPPSAASKMIKKLSTTFRRKSNASPNTILSTSQALSPTSHIATPLVYNPPSSKGRSMTFSAGSRADPTPDIPFFGERDAASDRKNPGSVAVVRGKPAWMRPSDQSALAVAVVAGRPPPAAPYPRQHSHQPTATPPMQHRQQQPTNTREADVVTYSRHRHFSFDVDRTRDNLPPVAPAQEPIVRPPSGRRRRASRRRWLLPLPESPDVPRLFTPPAGSQFERIARHRDRAEAKVLMSACTYIEAELDRLSNQYQNVREGACCCKKDSQSPQPSCECGHRLFLATSAERLRGVLGILEDRYDSIEQVYVKSEEYAKAMGKFFQVSPNEFSRMVSDRELASRDSRKSIRS